MTRRRTGLAATRLTAAALVLVALGACTGAGTSAPSASPSPTDSTPGAAPSGAWDCHVGTFQVTRIQTIQDTSTPLGEIRVAAAPGVLSLTTRPDGTWTAVADPSQPVTLQAGNVTGKATADGEIAGTYQRTGGTIDFTVTQVTGEVTSRLGNARHTDPLARFAPAIAPNGTTTVACGASDLQLGSATIRLTLTRVADPRDSPSVPRRPARP